MNSLSIFVNEPLMEWRKFAQEQVKRRGKVSFIQSDSDNQMNDASMSAPKWYPQQKLEICKRKLDGESPFRILVDELDNAHSGKKFISGLRTAVLSLESEFSESRTDRQRESSVESQVLALVKLASSPITLGRAWEGWAPFL
jgi:DNA-dependent protein kinase catalytic subunit